MEDGEKKSPDGGDNVSAILLVGNGQVYISERAYEG